MTDLRLVPAAVLAWLACAVGVGWSARTALLTCAVVVVVVVGLAFVALPHERQVPDRGRVLATIWLALVAVAVALGSCAAQVYVRDQGLLPDLAAHDATVTVVGTVRSEPLPIEDRWPGGTSRVRFVLAVEQISGRGVDGDAAASVLVMMPAQNVRYGSRVEVTGQLSASEPGDDVRGVLNASRTVREVHAPGSVDATVGRIRRALLDVTDSLPADQRGLVPGAAIGDTTRMPADLDQAMRDVSLTHITAVSGGHFAVLSAVILGLTAAMRLPRWARAVVTGLAMTGFVVLVHPDPSVVRAAVMGGVCVLGIALGRPSRSVPALATAVVLLVVIDPWLARAYGFILSVLATGALALLAPAIAARLAWMPRWLAVAVSVPVAAQAVCGPVLVLLDPSVSVYAVLANILAAPALFPATVFGVAAALAAPVAPAIAGVLAHGAGASVWWIAFVARTCAGLPGARHDWPSGPVGALAMVAGTVAILAIIPALRRWGVRAGVVIAVVVLIAMLPGARGLLRTWPPRDWQVVACDVGQGDSLVVSSGPQAAVVVDVGPDGSAADACLDELGITRIDLLVLTHYHADHVGGLEPVLADREVRQALVGPLDEPSEEAARTRAVLQRAGIPIWVGSATGEHASGSAGEVMWTVMSPTSSSAGMGTTEPTGSQINDASLVILLRTPDLTVLDLGDVETSSQERLAARIAREAPTWSVDVVKVAHHGSAHQCGELVELLVPPVALISVGIDNDYGHPAEQTVASYRSQGSLVLGTQECGSIAVGRDPGGVGLEVSAQCLDDG